MLPDALSVILRCDWSMLEHVCELRQAKALLQFMHLNTVVGTDAHARPTTYDLRIEIRS